jgi:hypothetical protein
MQFTRQTLAAAIGAAFSGLAANAWATNGDQMIGVTATQWGMAGAVTAAPQDAATMMFNPAGAAELGIEEGRFDMGFGLLNPPRTANGVESDSNWYLMPAGAVAFNVDNRLYFAMSMGGLSGMGVDFSDVMPAAGSMISGRSAQRSTSITRAWRCTTPSTRCRRTRPTATASHWARSCTSTSGSRSACHGSASST